MSDGRLREAERAALHDPSEAQRLGAQQCRASGCPTLDEVQAVSPQTYKEHEAWLDRINWNSVRVQVSEGARWLHMWNCPRCGARHEETRP